MADQSNGVEAERRRSRALRILEDADAVIRGDHFVYVTGEHGDGWIDKDAIFPDTPRASELCGLLAEALAEVEADLVCGPATGGLIVSQWTAHHLGLPSVFADHGKEQGYHPVTAGDGPLRPFVLNRGYDLAVRGRRVIVVDDVVNTGESLLETVEAVRAADGDVVAVGALCDRGNATADDVGSQTFISLATIDVPSWPAVSCELCGAGVPVNTRYAHGVDFLAAQAASGA